MNTVSSRRLTVDVICADAVEIARSALDALASPETVGEHLGVEADDERVVTHLFGAALPGYRGWRWAVTVARASRGRTVTVDDAVLLPGPDSLLSREWVPWTERLRPGDLGVGDLLPTDEDDDRLEPGWNATPVAEVSDGQAADLDEDEVTFAELVASLDLARLRVLSPVGLDDAFDRWQSGDHGPDAPMAQSAPATCASCGFRLPVRGLVGQAFGLCANAIAPSDGHVVALDYGCGAHSEAVVIRAVDVAGAPVIDEVGYDMVLRDEHQHGTVLDEDPGEELGHG